MNEGRDYEEKKAEIRAFYSCEKQKSSFWDIVDSSLEYII